MSIVRVSCPPIASGQLCHRLMLFVREEIESKLGLPAACGRVAARALRAAGQQVCRLGNSLEVMDREGAGKRRGV